jgi:predicted O-linked N-acetylglucosamine transferase (SPINDLY family)
MFAHKPAPVQVSFAGYPESSGVDAIGYRISDRWLEAMPVADYKSQDRLPRSVRPDLGILHPTSGLFLIDSFWCYDPCGIDLPVNELPARECGRITFGSLTNFCKVNDPALRLWAQILRAAKDSRLVLLCRPGSHRLRVTELLTREGIEAARVDFVEPCARKSYLETYHRLDVMLDTFPYGGHTTSLDALWMGVPMVSLTGKTPVSRAGLSILNNLGLPELIADSAEDYVRIATDLAGDLPRLGQLRATLRRRMETSLLMDGPQFTRQIEAAYRAVWQHWCAKELR